MTRITKKSSKQEPCRRVLGIDPGLANTGYGVVRLDGSKLRAVTTGCIKTRSKQPLAARLLLIYNEILEVIGTFEPQAVAVEQIFFAKNASSALQVGQALGVCLLAAAQHEIPAFQYSPNGVKLAVTGYGRASKEQVQKMVSALLALHEQPRSDHVSDALAVAICHIHGAGNAMGRLTGR